MIRVLKTLFLALIAYLFEVCVMTRIEYNGASPNMILIITAIVIVAYGRQHGFMIAAINGIIMESMMQSLVYFYLITLPSCAALGLFFFADKTERRMEIERALHKNYNNMNPILRTLLCTLFMTTIFEFATIAYCLLNGMVFSEHILQKSIISILYSLILCAIIIVPVRKFMGLESYLPKIRKQKKKENRIIDPNLGRQPILNNSVLNRDPNVIVPENHVSSILDKEPESLPDIDKLYKDDEKQYYRLVDKEEIDKVTQNIINANLPFQEQNTEDNNQTKSDNDISSLEEDSNKEFTIENKIEN